MERSALAGTLIALAVLAAGFAVAFLVGRFPVSPADIAAVLWSKISDVPSGVSSATEAVILQVRGPRVIAAFLEAGTARDLDARCLDRAGPDPFFLDAAGPAP